MIEIFKNGKKERNPNQPKFHYEDLVEGLKNNKFKKIAVLTGPEIRFSAGYPDFREKTLFDEDLPNPRAIFDIKYFREKPHSFYKFAK